MRPKPAFLVTLAASIGSLYAIDLFLARTESIERRDEAREYYESGSRLLDRGQAQEAVEVLRKAHTADRTDQQYSLRLAEALVADSKLDEARGVLAEALERGPNDGPTNLLEARLLAREGRFDEATYYYHRSIYGSWDTSSGNRPADVRMELAELLAKRGSNQALLAELLALESETNRDPGFRRKIAHLYMVAGSPARAEEAYRALIHIEPLEGSDYAGLGEADLRLGKYRAAESAFQSAIQHGYDAASRMDLASRMDDLDPTIRQLSPQEKYARSVRLLRMARDEVDSCPPSDAISEADAMLHSIPSRGISNERAEERLAMTERLWRLRATCGSQTAPNDELLSLILAKLRVS